MKNKNEWIHFNECESLVESRNGTFLYIFYLFVQHFSQSNCCCFVGEIIFLNNILGHINEHLQEVYAIILIIFNNSIQKQPPMTSVWGCKTLPLHPELNKHYKLADLLYCISCFYRVCLLYFSLITQSKDAVCNFKVFCINISHYS